MYTSCTIPRQNIGVESLVKGVFSSTQFGEGTLASTSYPNAVIDISITDRYFRALAKMGFHYFLTQFPEFTGHEEAFAALRHFILENDGGIAAVDNFVRYESTRSSEPCLYGPAPQWVARSDA